MTVAAKGLLRIELLLTIERLLLGADLQTGGDLVLNLVAMDSLGHRA